MTSTSAAAYAAHAFYADSKVGRVPTPVSFAAPIELAIASTLDEALLLALGEVHYATDEDALDLGLRRALGDDVPAATLAAAPAPVFMPEVLPPVLELAPPPAPTFAAPPSTDVEATAVMPAPTADVAVAAAPSFAAVEHAVSARAEVLDQDLRAQGDEDESACELEFFSKQ